VRDGIVARPALEVQHVLPIGISVKYVAAVLALDALMFAGCNYKGEGEGRGERSSDLAYGEKTAIGAAGSTFIAPIMNELGLVHTSKATRAR